MEEDAAFLEPFNPQPQVKSKRTFEKVSRATRKKYKESCLKRKVKNERYIDATFFGHVNLVVQTVARHGLSFRLGPNNGYNLWLDQQFYKNLEEPEKGKEVDVGPRVVSRIGKKMVEIDPKIIAHTMGYKRPMEQV